MPRKSFDPSKRSVLVRAVKVAGLFIAVGSLMHNRPAVAKAAKSDFMYQDHRHDGKGCGDCKFFVPVSGSEDGGTCSVVDGSVSRNGWCIAFSPRGST